eukprot:Phypoly_transcript_12389.p1 GENE.Phypoly_transcript_12389~~Phypoly_transcript_12389.p1  ORF type:complete len:318 (+),score=35.65 Phypoly_transcript_12389:106-1059(+)
MSVEILTELERITVDAFCHGRHPVCLETTSRVSDALKTFNSQKILSVPIATPEKEKAGVHGFLDLFDLLSYLLQLWDDNKAAEVDGIQKLGEQFLNHNVCDLIDRSDNDVYAAVTGNEHAHRLIRLFGLGVHRVAMLDMRGSLANILSQSDVVKYLYANIQLLGELANKPISNLKMISSDKLVTADSEQTAISAFQLLGQNFISAVPIIDKDGVLTGTLSLSDLKLLQNDLSPLLFTTVQYKSIKDSIPSVVCTPDTTLGAVIGLLASNNIHRVWVVDSEHKPTSVISVTNVCEFLTQFLPKEEGEEGDAEPRKVEQ